MDYEKKYKEALKAAISAHKDEDRHLKATLERIFHELKESDDERIRKDMISYVKGIANTSNISPDQIKECNAWIAWLEKQKPVQNINKEDEEVRQYIIRIMEQRDINVPMVQKVLTWLEKQGTLYTKRDVDDAYLKGISDAKNELEKQGEQNPFDYENANIQQKDFAPKVEPKFKAGDWIISKYMHLVMQILNNDNGSYKTVETDGTERNDSYDFIERNFKLWTIQDAKDGDVLWHSDTASHGTFIFKQIRYDGKVLCYCDYDSEDHFCTGEHHTCCWSSDKCIKPATKEQRDLLFTKMRKAGYEWDAENLQLTKILHVKELSDGINIDKQKLAEWSEEDEKTWKELIEEVKDQLDSVPAPDCRDKEDEKVLKQLTRWLVWLKSLKDRYTWKPNIAQLNALSIVLKGNAPDDIEAIVSLYNDLKKLKGE